MHDRLFANQQELAREDLSKHAQALGLDVAAFDQCLDSGTHVARLRKDQADALRVQATGTPTFFLGLTDPNGSQITAVARFFGAKPFETFKAAIEELLASQK